jgi:hypothetical protein
MFGFSIIYPAGKHNRFESLFCVGMLGARSLIAGVAITNSEQVETNHADNGCTNTLTLSLRLRGKFANSSEKRR